MSREVVRRRAQLLRGWRLLLGTRQGRAATRLAVRKGIADGDRRADVQLATVVTAQDWRDLRRRMRLSIALWLVLSLWALAVASGLEVRVQRCPIAAVHERDATSVVVVLVALGRVAQAQCGSDVRET